MTRRGISSVLVVGLLLALLVTPALAKTEIRMVTYGDSYDAYRNIEKAFNEAHPDFELVIEAYPFVEYISKLTVMIAAGAPPDVFQTWAQYKPAWVEEGLLLDITPYWNESAVAQDANLYPFIMDSGMYNGKIYGVPHDFNAHAWVIHNDAFDRAGIAPPAEDWTVDDMAQYAMKLTDPNNDFYGVQLAGHWSTSHWQWAVLYNGEGWLNADRTEVLVDGPENVEMLEFWYDLVFNRGAANSPGQPAARDHWQGGYAMWQGWTGWSFNLANVAPYEWSLATLPKGPAGQDAFAQGHMWSIPSNASDPDKSWVLLEWLLSDEGQRTIVMYENRQPLSNDADLWSLYFSRLPVDKQRPVQNFVMNTLFGQDLVHNMTYWTTWSQMDQIMNRHLNTIFYDQLPPSNAMSRAATEMRVVLEEN